MALGEPSLRTGLHLRLASLLDFTTLKTNKQTNKNDYTVKMVNYQQKEVVLDSLKYLCTEQGNSRKLSGTIN